MDGFNKQKYPVPLNGTLVTFNIQKPLLILRSRRRLIIQTSLCLESPKLCLFALELTCKCFRLTPAFKGFGILHLNWNFYKYFIFFVLKSSFF